MFKHLLDKAALVLEKSSVNEWELMLAQSVNLSLGIKEKEIDKLQESESLGFSLRVIKDQRLGFSYLMGSDLTNLPKALEMALAGALVSEPEPGFTFAMPDNSPLDPAFTNGDAGDEAASMADYAARAVQMVESAHGASGKVSHVYPAEISQSGNQVFVRNSKGVDRHYGYSVVWAGCAAIAEENGQQEEAWEGKTARSWSDIDLAGIGRAAGLKAVSALGATAAPSGRYQVLFSNEVVAYFIGLLASSLKADNISKGRSMLAGRQGEKILSPLFSLTDNPLHATAPFSRPFDDEGTTSQVTPLFENGVMRGFISDRLWANRLKIASSGNSQRASIKSPPEVGFSNLMLSPGKISPEGMTAGMRTGIIVEQVLGGHMADPVSGNFSLGLAGKLVKDGQIVGPVRGNAMAGQVVELFAQIDMVGNDIDCFGQTWAASLLVPQVAISGPAD